MAGDNADIAGLFLAISAVFTIKESPQIFTRTLVNELNKLPHQLWSPLTRGKPLSEQWLAQLLRPYGIAPKILSLPGNRARGYTEADFHEPFRRYVTRARADALLAEIASEPDGTTGLLDLGQTRTGNKCASVMDQ